MIEAGSFYINVSRLHPLVVHLPIGILAFAFFLELCRLWKKDLDLDLPIKLALFLGVVSAAMAALTGWLLAEEGGYQESTLERHRWLGLSVVAVASMAFAGVHFQWRPIWRRGLMTTLILLMLITGHLGGNMTYGADYLFTRPISRTIEPIVDIEGAQVFEQIVQPIIEEKCTSCHNPSKSKGGLILTTSAGILAGGETGLLFDHKNPDQGLLLARINLPPDHEEHMPPSGKAQLTKDEELLLKWWVDNQACLSCKVLETTNREPVSGALDRVVEASQPDPFADISPPTDEDLQQLQLAGINVKPIADGHPMLSVNLSHESDIAARLKQLADVADNVLELNLAATDFSDEMAAKLASFSNVRTLQLQNTQVTSETIHKLVALAHLETLNVYNTHLGSAAASALGNLESLKKLFVWNTGLTSDNLEQLSKSRPQLQIVRGGYTEIFNETRLGGPQILLPSLIFVDSIAVEMDIKLPGASIYYTLDGSKPGSSSNLYESPFYLTHTTFIRAIGEKPGWESSDTTEEYVLKAGKRIEKVTLSKEPNEKYRAKGGASLINHIKGSQLFTDGQWLGYEGVGFKAILEMASPGEVSSLVVSALAAQGSWIFYPKSITVSFSEDGRSFREANRLEVPLVQDSVLIEDMRFFEVPVAIEGARFIEVAIENHGKNPDWHPNPGGKSWVFIDEILVN